MDARNEASHGESISLRIVATDGKAIAKGISASIGYSLSAITGQATLFSPCAVVIAWGRRDNDFQQWRAISVDTPDQASQLAAKIVERKIKRGYQVHMNK